MTSEMSRRLLEMEKKKQKLAELKAEKIRQEEERRQSVLQALHNNENRKTATKEELDALLRSVGIEDEELLNRSEEKENKKIVEPGSPKVFKSPKPLPLTKVKSELETEGKVDHANPNLHISPITHHILPVLPVKKTLISYSKSVQTDIIEEPIVDKLDDETQIYDNVKEPDTPEPIIPQVSVPEKLTEEEKQHILNQTNFQIFFNNAAKLVGKQLELREEQIQNYLEDDESGGQNIELVTLSCHYMDPKWTANRQVTSMAFSTKFPDLLAVAYDANTEDPYNWRGVVCVWTTRFKKQPPEFVFYCTQRLTNITFVKPQEHLLMGGCASGRIIVWNMKNARKTLTRTTQLQSPLCAKANTAAICCLFMTGQNLYTISVEGRICWWYVNELASPIASYELQQTNYENKIKTIDITSVSFAPDGKSFVVGAADGVIAEFDVSEVKDDNPIQEPLQTKEGEKEELQIPKIMCRVLYDEFVGGGCPVMAADFHAARGACDFSYLFLTCSDDWSIKLWNSKDILLYWHFDYHQAPVVDVKWSPVHPAVFASIDLTGMLCVWNLNENTDCPIHMVDVLQGKGFLRKLLWSQNGQKICVGDSKGAVYLFECNEKLHSTNTTDFVKFARRVKEAKRESAEKEKQRKEEFQLKIREAEEKEQRVKNLLN